MANPTFSFRLKPQEAISYLEQKGFKQSFHSSEIMHQAHNTSFTVAKIMRDDLLTDMHSSLLQAQADGIGFREWQKRIKPTLVDYGWYGKTEVIDPRTGEVTQIEVGSRRLKTIFETNMSVAHAQSRLHKQKSLPFSHYWMYLSMLLPTSRATHRAKHGRVLHRDDPWWRTNYPPNAWGCHCKVRAYTKSQLDKRGIQIEQSMRESIASKDWAYDLSKGTPPLDKLRDSKIDALPKHLRARAREEREIDKLYTQAISGAPTQLQNYLLTHRPSIKKLPIKTPAHYNKSTQTIAYRDALSLATMRHELGHALDYSQDTISIKKLSTLKLDQVMILKNQEEIASMLESTKEVYIHDLFYLNTKGKLGVQTRDSDYLITSSIRAQETFATIFEIILSNNQQRIKIIKQYFPSAYRAVQKILRRL